VAGGIRWLAGEPSLCARLERLIPDPAAGLQASRAGPGAPVAPAGEPGAAVWLLRDKPGRRRLLRVRLADGSHLFVKQGHARGARALPRLAELFGVDAARREWSALARLSQAGVAVPRPRALGRLPGGGTLLALDFLEGRPLPEWLARGASRRNALVLALGDLLAAMHAAGWVHGDLHAGNVLVTDAGPVLTDFQAALPLRSRRARLRDLGELDGSVWRALSLAQRVRLRASALRLERPFGAGARRELGRVARASRARARARARSRRRRALRPGRRFEAFDVDGWRGLRRRRADAEALARAVRRHLAASTDGAQAAQVSACEERYAVRSFARQRPRTLLPDLCAPARRAWLAAVGLEAHGIACERPLAWLSARDGSGLLVVERPLGARPSDAAARRGADPPRLASALARRVMELHGRGVAHHELTAGNLWVAPRGDACEAWVGGLEGVRFPRRLAAQERARELARLEASLRSVLPEAQRALLLQRCRLFGTSD
jgi:tRNA A-37 threonylcarbamoyl transferase component Bud32